MTTNGFLRGNSAPIKVKVGREPLKPPNDLPTPVKVIFRRLAKQLANRCAEEDVPMLAQLATSEWVAKVMLADMVRNGVTDEDEQGSKRRGSFVAWRQASLSMLTIGAHFGMTPASRSRLRVDEGDEDGSLMELFADVQQAAG